MKRIPYLVTASIAGVFLPHLQAQSNLVETASAAGQFQTLVAAVKAADLVETLVGEGPFTVFAPTDEAFAALPSHQLEALLEPENRDRLTAILTYHVVPGRVLAKDAFGLDVAPTVNGQQLDIDATASGLRVDEARVVKADIQCSNGVIHVIDRVLIPESRTIAAVASEAGSFKTLVAAAKAAGLVEALVGDGPLTVFAPTDDAFAALGKTVDTLLEPENKDQLVAILQYHVVPGRVFAKAALGAGRATSLQGQAVAITFDENGARVNESRLLQTDIDAANGVIHVIDKVLLPAQLGAAGARQRLEAAVADGAARFNRGDAHACLRVYSETLEGILADAGPGLPQDCIRILELSLERVQDHKSAEDKCWALRQGIDLAYYALGRGTHH